MEITQQSHVVVVKRGKYQDFLSLASLCHLPLPFLLQVKALKNIDAHHLKLLQIVDFPCCVSPYVAY